MSNNSTEAKTKILSSAIEIISKKGYSAATTNEIAKAAGYSEATIFKYFKSKKGLLNAIVYALIDNKSDFIGLNGLRSIINNKENLTFEEIFDHFLEDRLHFIENNFGLIKVLFMEIQFHDDFRNLVIANIINPLIKDLDVFIKKQIAANNIVEIDTALLMRTIFSGIFIAVLQRIIMKEDIDITMVRKEFQIIKKIYLNGIIKK